MPIQGLDECRKGGVVKIIVNDDKGVVVVESTSYNLCGWREVDLVSFRSRAKSVKLQSCSQGKGISRNCPLGCQRQWRLKAQRSVYSNRLRRYFQARGTYWVCKITINEGSSGGVLWIVVVSLAWWQTDVRRSLFVGGRWCHSLGSIDRVDEEVELFSVAEEVTFRIP